MPVNDIQQTIPRLKGMIPSVIGVSPPIANANGLIIDRGTLGDRTDFNGSRLRATGTLNTCWGLYQLGGYVGKKHTR